jgi:GNAT superfamily N-acetyltransferase
MAAQFKSRLATVDDIPLIVALMRAAITQNMQSFLSAEEIEAAQATMGLDTTLIDDQTYFIIETDTRDPTTMVGCGGWGLRKTLYGGDHSAGRDDSLSDPRCDPARIRAMYAHPDWTRKGIGSMLLALGEEAARRAGFKTIELGATLAGEPLYRKCGYVEYARDVTTSPNGAANTVIRMRKIL